MCHPFTARSSPVNYHTAKCQVAKCTEFGPIANADFYFFFNGCIFEIAALVKGMSRSGSQLTKTKAKDTDPILL